MYPAFEFEFNNGTRGEAYQAAHRHAVKTIRPLECCGEAGTVIFWHGRCLHSRGIHTGRTVRLAIPGDFQQAGRETVPPVRPAFPLSKDVQKKVNGLEWFKDTLPFAEDIAPQADMWASWQI